MPQVAVEYRAFIKSSAAKLWDIIADVEHWPDKQLITYYNPSSSGLIEAGSTFMVKDNGLTWRLEVTNADKPRKMYWIGDWLGLHAEHEWEFHEEAGGTTAINRESITGWMLLIAYPIVKNKLPSTNERWLADLKARAEKGKWQRLDLNQ